MSNKRTIKRAVTPLFFCSPERCDGRRGAALFTAIAMLTLFTLLGASYVHFLMVEDDLCTLDLRKLRSQFYAEAGIQSSAAYLQETLRKGMLPVTSTTHTFPVYGYTQGSNPDRPVLLDNYRAEVSASMSALSAEDWQEFNFSPENFPGEGLVWKIESSAVLLKNAALDAYPLSRHSIAAVVSLDRNEIQVLSWRTCR